MSRLSGIVRAALAMIGVALLLAAPALAQKRHASSSPVINTVAGCCEPTGMQGYAGDGGPATSAEFNFPYGLALDPSANFYVADSNNCIIRKVTAATGIITTFAGTDPGLAIGGHCGYSGDGGPATSAELSEPTGVAVDTAGNLYIADSANFVIRKVSASTGVISTVAGCCETSGGPGTSGYAGDGGPATSAELSYPYGVAVDASGNLYIADAGNNVIRKVTASTGVITTVAGEGPNNFGYSGDGGPATSAELFSPYGITVDSAGNFYIADTINNVIRKVTASNGKISTVAGDYALGSGGYGGDGGPATSAQLYNPTGVAVDASGNIDIADSTNNLVREVTVSSGIINTVAGEYTLGAGYSGDGGAATSAGLDSPTGIGLDSAGNLYIADDDNQVIREVVVSSLAITTTAVASSLNPSNEGQSVTFTAKVGGGSSPTGTVSFTSNGTAISGCSGVTLVAGKAVCLTSSLPVGSNLIVASYSGDSNNEGSSGSLTQVVNTSTLPPTTTAVTSSQNPSTAGKLVTFTATISPVGPPTPTGTVGFTSNGTTITGCSAIAVTAASTAQCSTGALAAGTDAIVATYSGDDNYMGSSGSLSQLVNPAATAVQFFSLTPCRVVDTRTDNAFSGGIFAAGETRSYALPSGPCAGIPSTAVAYSLNVTVVPPAPLGFLTIWPTGEGQPTVSTLNSLDGRIKANAAIVPAGTGGAVSVYVNNSTQVVLDIDGYFAASSSSSLEFYPLTPCRVADTRKSSGYATGLGSPSLVADMERDFPIMSASGNAVPCDIPATALAYSLNFTAVPPSGGNLGYLTVWPTGESQPLVSTLNDYTGTVVANAAIVPAGSSGDVAVYPSNATDLVIDINGYFAAATPAGLQLYALTPCRVLDTRKTSGAFSNTTLVVNVAGSACAPPSTAQAYVFNATVVPTGDLGYLSLWPDSETQPVVSTLNAQDGAITSNMAIVPNANGSVDAYASGTTQLILDISAYFAP